MSAKIRCRNCGRLFVRDVRVRSQSYCGAKVCQKARKAAWQRQRMAEDDDYRADQREGQKIWRDKSPDYWRRYRQSHPQYCERNRMLQKWRDARAKSGDLAKMDASARIMPLISGTYYLIPDLAKMDAFRQKVHIITAG